MQSTTTRMVSLQQHCQLNRSSLHQPPQTWAVPPKGKHTPLQFVFILDHLDSNLFSSRLQTELMQLMTSSAPGISAFPSEDNILSWTATIDGPDDTPYADLTFKLSFDFPANYPYASPTVLFITPIYHPNVDFSGRICLDILKDKWTAAYNIQTVLLSLQSLLGEPNK